MDYINIDKHDNPELKKTMIFSNRENMLINYIKEKVKQRKNIGNEIILLVDKEELIEKVHKSAQEELLKAIKRPTSINLIDNELIVVSLVIIGLKNYDGNFYDYVEETYSEIYNMFTRQKIEGTIRSIIKKYIPEDSNFSRLINYVLENAIVPLNFLPNFFDFMYDIYKVNFEHILPEKTIEDELEFVYDGLRDAFMEDSDELSTNVTNKTYKLIKSTKNLIFKKDSIKSLINMSKNVLEIIDNYYWKNKVDLEKKYYDIGLKKWLINNEKEVKVETTKKQHNADSYSRWLPRFELIQKDIYLHIPEHNIKKEYDYRDINVYLYENDKIKQKIETLRFFEIFGGYKIVIGKIRLENPLANLRYKICSGKEVIYDSKDYLYRKVLFFNESGKEISENKDYLGNLLVCYKKSSQIDEDIDSYYNGTNYCLGIVYITPKNILKIDNEVYSFSSKMSTGLIGEKIENTYIQIPNKKMQVYRNITEIVLETILNNEEIGLSINGKKEKLKELNYTLKIDKDKNIFIIEKNLCDAQFYKIEFFEIKTGKTIINAKFEIAVDPNLSFNTEKIDDENYILNIKSDLNLEQEEYNISLRDFDQLKIKVQNKDITGIYELPIDIPIYRIDNGKWNSIYNYLWVDDIKYSSKIYFRGFDLDSILIKSNNNQILNRLNVIKKDNYYVVDADSLKNYKENMDSFELILLKDESAKYFINCYTRLTLMPGFPNISYNSEEKELNIDISFYGKGKLQLNIEKCGGEILYSKELSNNDYNIIIPEFPSNIEVQIIIREKNMDFSLIADRVLYNEKMNFFSYYDLVNKCLKVLNVDFEHYLRNGECIRKTFYFHRTYFELKQYLGNKKFIGKAYIMENGIRKDLKNVNPVEIELVGEIRKTEVEASAQVDGDGLLIDFERKTILDSLYDLKAPDIFTCNLKIERNL